MLEKLPESLGRALQGQRAGIENIALWHLPPEREVLHLTVRSSAFDHMAAIPVQFTADGDGLSPPLEWRGVPETATTVVLIVEDADSPTPHPLVHAIAITSGGDGALASGALTRAEEHEAEGTDVSRVSSAEGPLAMGLNSYLQRGWLAPDPPPGHGPHRYAFQLFALGPGASLTRSPGRQQLLEAIRGHAVAAGCLIGTYERVRRQRVADAEASMDTEAAILVDDAAPQTA